VKLAPLEPLRVRKLCSAVKYPLSLPPSCCAGVSHWTASGVRSRAAQAGRCACTLHCRSQWSFPAYGGAPPGARGGAACCPLAPPLRPQAPRWRRRGASAPALPSQRQPPPRRRQLRCAQATTQPSSQRPTHTLAGLCRWAAACGRRCASRQVPKEVVRLLPPRLSPVPSGTRECQPPLVLPPGQTSQRLAPPPPGEGREGGLQSAVGAPSMRASLGRGEGVMLHQLRPEAARVVDASGSPAPSSKGVRGVPIPEDLRRQQ